MSGNIMLFRALGLCAGLLLLTFGIVDQQALDTKELLRQSIEMTMGTSHAKYCLKQRYTYTSLILRPTDIELKTSRSQLTPEPRGAEVKPGTSTKELKCPPNSFTFFINHEGASWASIIVGMGIFVGSLLRKL